MNQETEKQGSYDPSVRGPVRRKVITVDAITTLKNKAKTDSVFKDIMLVFALRERTRRQVTVAGLQLRMKQEKYNYDKSYYRDAISFLASIGYGKVETDKNGEVYALKNVVYTLQSIGKVALNEADSRIEKAKFLTNTSGMTFSNLPHIKETPVVSPEKAAVKIHTVVPKVKFEGKTEELFKTSITMYVGNEPVTFPLPKGMTTNELGELLVKLYKKETVA